MSHTKLTALWGLSLAALTLSACGGGRRTHSIEVPQEDLPPANIVIQSSLTGQAQQVLEAPSDDPCDKADADAKREIFKALEAKNAALFKLVALPPELPEAPNPASTPSPSPSASPSGSPSASQGTTATASVPSTPPSAATISPPPAPSTPATPSALPLLVGSAIFFREVADPAENEWGNRTLPSWTELRAKLEAIRDQEANSAWLNLNEQALSVLSQDVARLLRKRNMSLRPEQVEDLRELDGRIAACLASAGCPRADILADLPPRLRALIDASPIYSAWDARLRHDKEADDIVRDLGALGAWVQRDRRAVTFVKQPGVRRGRAGELIVELDSGDFADDEAREALEQIFLERWKTPTRRLRIEWKDPPEASKDRASSPFHLLISWALGMPSFVDYVQRTLNLVHGARTWTVQHELGHTLGLPDSYFVNWDSATCRYTIRSNAGDLMSAPGAGGRVLDAHWRTLFDAYR